MALAWLGSACALSTPLGELPRETSGDATAVETETGTGSGGITTVAPPPVETDGTTGVVGPLPMHAWVMRYDDWLMATEDTAETDSGPSDSGNGTGTGPDIAPDALVVQISTGSDDCIDPGAALECGAQWQISMLIPPELQVPGTYLLFEELSGFVSMTGELEPGGFCSGGAGTLEGTATLLVVSEVEVQGFLSGTEGSSLFGIDTDVEFIALGC
ncbi:hypothetical protein [Paraliomyxa miuraensis]|uniref:hypothetical protein n=1 Tax=Paraliomyxa miuraensis TaxID=376150 RepID=UPI0022572D59|nr:hypothetical protein [Paraliomyxa miuraensis]MCX4242693.1 hypothetical protein [Paraliomyxa miuraensis]